MTTDAPVGIIGLGLMGTALVERLTGAGIEVIGFDVDCDRCDAFEDSNRKVAASASDPARQSQSVVFAVYDRRRSMPCWAREIHPARPTNLHDDLRTWRNQADRDARGNGRLRLDRGADIGHQR